MSFNVAIQSVSALTAAIIQVHGVTDDVAVDRGISLFKNIVEKLSAEDSIAQEWLETQKQAKPPFEDWLETYGRQFGHYRSDGANFQPAPIDGNKAPPGTWPLRRFEPGNDVSEERYARAGAERETEECLEPAEPVKIA